MLTAKYDAILHPIAERVLVPEQTALTNKKYMTYETLFHELSHSLGPGSIVVNGRATTVDAEMKEIGGQLEKAKADVMGIYNVMLMMQKGEIPAAERSQLSRPTPPASSAPCAGATRTPMAAALRCNTAI